MNNFRRRFLQLREIISHYRLYIMTGVLLALFIIAAAFFLNSPTPDILSPVEREWLNQHQGIRIAPDPNFPPIEFIDKNGEYRGLVADYLSIMQEHLHYQFTIVKYGTWEKVIEAAKSGEIDGITAAHITPDRKKYLNFTKPILEIPFVFINRKGESTTLTFETLQNKIVAITQGNAMNEYIQQNFPKIHLVLVSDDFSALSEVSFNQVDATILNLSIASNLIETSGFSNLQMAGDPGVTNILAIASRKDWPMLNTIMEKGFDSISPVERQAIEDKWLGLGNPTQTIGRQFWQTIFLMVSIVFLGFLGVMIWNSALRKKVNNRTAELLQSNEKYRVLVDNASEGVIVTHKSKLLFANQAALDITGYSLEEALNTDVVSITYPEDREKVWNQIMESMGLGKPAVNYHCRAVTKNGEVRWFSNHSIEIMWENQHAGLTLFNDVTEQRKAEEQIQRQLRHLASLRAAEMAITASMDLPLTLRVLLDQVIGQLGVDATDILLLNPTTLSLEYAADRGFKTGFARGTHLRMGKGFAWEAVSDRKIIQASRNSNRQPNYLDSPELSSEGFNSYIGTPLIAKGVVKGVLEIYQRSSLNPDSEWMEFLEAIAGQAAIAIDNAGLFEEVQRTNLDLTISYDATIEGWAHALELRDGETEGHSKRVCRMTMSLAASLDVPEEGMVHIRRGALLHDIGKMGIPDSILLKPGPLTPDEWKIMRMHPIYGRDLLFEVEYLRPAVEIPFCHHERWDGTGYPQQLKEEEIPLAARIFTVVDVWDALTSDRPYRPRWNEEDARQYLIEQSGKQFDPRVVEAFLKTIPQPERFGETSSPTLD